MHNADVQAPEAAAINQQGVTRYSQEPYAALAVLKLTTLLQPARAPAKGREAHVVGGLCWSLLESLTKQLPDHHVVLLNASEEHVSLSVVKVLTPVMRQTVKSKQAQFTGALDLMVAPVRNSKPALAAKIAFKIAAARRMAEIACLSRGPSCTNANIASHHTSNCTVTYRHLWVCITCDDKRHHRLVSAECSVLPMAGSLVTHMVSAGQERLQPRHLC